MSDAHVPDHLPPGKALAEELRLLRDALNAALETDEEALQLVAAQVAAGLDRLARHLDEQGD